MDHFVLAVLAASERSLRRNAVLWKCLFNRVAGPVGVPWVNRSASGWVADYGQTNCDQMAQMDLSICRHKTCSGETGATWNDINHSIRRSMITSCRHRRRHITHDDGKSMWIR